MNETRKSAVYLRRVQPFYDVSRELPTPVNCATT